MRGLPLNAKHCCCFAAAVCLQVKLWELASRSLVQTLTEHSDQVWGCAFSADGKRLASVSDDKQLVVYSVA